MKHKLIPPKKVIVLAAGPLESNGEFAEFLNGMYAGGQIRMEAAAKLLADYPSTELILVGGYNKIGEGDTATSNKVNDMATFLRSHQPAAKLQLVNSLPCTHHNLVAVIHNWTSTGAQLDEVGLLSSAYHLERAIFFAKQAAAASEHYKHLSFIPMPAEEILGKSFESLIQGRQAEYAARLASERRGLQQLAEGTYQDSCLTKNLELVRPVLQQHVNELMSADELRNFAK